MDTGGVLVDRLCGDGREKVGCFRHGGSSSSSAKGRWKGCEGRTEGQRGKRGGGGGAEEGRAAQEGGGGKICASEWSDTRVTTEAEEQPGSQWRVQQPG